VLNFTYQCDIFKLYFDGGLMEKTALVLIELVNDAKHHMRKYVRSCGMNYSEYMSPTFKSIDRKTDILTCVIGVKVPVEELESSIKKIMNYFKLKEPKYCELVHIHNIFFYETVSKDDEYVKTRLMEEYKIVGWKSNGK
jgi:hypothetical protein